MKVELCSFSGYKIYPAHRGRYSRPTGRLSNFLVRTVSRDSSPRGILNRGLSSREESTKGTVGRTQENRTRRAVRFQRAVTGASLADVMAERSQKPEVRKARREQAIRAAEEARKAKQAPKETAVATARAPTKAAPKQKIVKPVGVSAPALVENAKLADQNFKSRPIKY